MADWGRMLRRARRRLLFLAVNALVRSVGFRGVRRLAAILGDMQYRFGGRTRQRCLHDLAALQQRPADDPAVARQLRESYRNYTAATLQVVAMCQRKLDLKILQSACRIDGLDELQRALDAGKGAILLATHAGNNLIVAALLASMGWPILVVYRQALMMSDDFFDAGLPRYGLEGLSANAGAKAYLRMRRAIKDNRIVFVMIDQGVKFPQDGVVMRFLGKDMPMPPGPAQLARVSGAPVLPLATVAAQPIWHFEIEPAVVFAPDSTVEQDLAELLRITERQLLAHPQLWSWPHRRWRKFPLAAQ
ncbi:MAG TPA: lysophospholipid acyltransferase family protein [Steroidobacteraceae bacterium]|nr:lysophospholipid acyltransferase family protein [Steroidobacteraceae bacterium]